MTRICMLVLGLLAIVPLGDGLLKAQDLFADVDVAIAATSTVQVGQSWQQQIYVHSSLYSTTAATGVVLTFLPPPNTSINSKSFPQDPTGVWCDLSRLPRGNEIVTCKIPDLGVNYLVTFFIELTPKKTGTIMSTARVTANEADPNPTNNQATALATVYK